MNDGTIQVSNIIYKLKYKQVEDKFPSNMAVQNGLILTHQNVIFLCMIPKAEHSTIFTIPILTPYIMSQYMVSHRSSKINIWFNKSIWKVPTRNIRFYATWSDRIPFQNWLFLPWFPFIHFHFFIVTSFIFKVCLVVINWKQSITSWPWCNNVFALNIIHLL